MNQDEIRYTIFIYSIGGRFSQVRIHPNWSQNKKTKNKLKYLNELFPSNKKGKIKKSWKNPKHPDLEVLFVVQQCGRLHNILNVNMCNNSSRRGLEKRQNLFVSSFHVQGEPRLRLTTRGRRFSKNNRNRKLSRKTPNKTDITDLSLANLQWIIKKKGKKKKIY